MARTIVGRTRLSARMLLSGVLLASSLTPGLALAHEGHVHKVMGIVTMSAPDHVMVKTIDVKTKAEKTVTIVVNDKTKVLRGTAAAKMGDVKEGDRVVVDIGAGKEPLTAREIKLGAAQPAAGTPAPASAAHAKHTP